MTKSALLLLALGAAAALRVPTAPLPHSPSLARHSPALAAAPPRVRAPPIALAAAAVAPVERLRTLLYKVGFASVWVQGVLTTVSGVLLLFCSSALQRASLPLLAGLVLALAGLAAACASSLWAWGYTRLSLRLGRGEAPSSADAARRATGRARLGLAVNLAGLTASLLGAEAIVGTLAAKSFTQGALTVATSPLAAVQPLDVLVVQAILNLQGAHFVGLCTALRLLRAAEACAEKGA